MVNVPLLRKVQASIADPNQPFDMSHWETCICGHVKHVATGFPISALAQPYELGGIWTTGLGAKFLGLSMPEAADLFTRYSLDRQGAIEALEILARMLDSTQPVPDPEPVEPPPAPEPELELVCV